VDGYQVTIGEADLGAVKNNARFTLGDFSISFSAKLSGHADAAHFSNTVTFGFPLSHHNDILDGLTRFGDYFLGPVLEKPTEYRCATPRGPDDEKMPSLDRGALAQVTPATLDPTPGTLDLDVLALEHDVAVLLHGERGRADLDQDLVLGLQDDLLTGNRVDLAAPPGGPVSAYAFVPVLVSPGQRR